MEWEKKSYIIEKGEGGMEAVVFKKLFIFAMCKTRINRPKTKYRGLTPGKTSKNMAMYKINGVTSITSVIQMKHV